MKSLIKATGWIGDAFFALSIPEKLKLMGHERVDFVSYRPQPMLLLRQNKSINNVYLKFAPDESIYDYIYDLPELPNKCIPQTIQWQQCCGIKNTSSQYRIDTVPDYDVLAEIFLSTLIQNKPFVAFQSDWSTRRWLYNEEEYSLGLVNKQGDMAFVLDKLHETNKINLIKISPYYSHSIDERGFCLDPNRYALLASIIKHCDYFLGCEGGLSNLAGGVGTKSIITMCHFYKYYGPKGINFINNGEFGYGPEKLFPNEGHKNLNPFLSNNEVLQEIKNIIL